MTKIYNSLNDVLDFGKYEKFTIEQVINTNPKYLIWALKDIEGFTLAEHIVSILRRISEEKRHAATTNDYSDYGDYELENNLDFVTDDLDFNTAVMNTDEQTFNDYMFVKNHFGL